MGAGSYVSREDVARLSTTRESSNAFNYDQQIRSGSVARGVHSDLNLLNKIRECLDSAEHPETTPIVWVLDVTESRGDDPLRVYEQVPTMLGSIIAGDIVPHPVIMSMAVGDANSDVAPLQGSQFEANRLIDSHLSKIYMEKGGGGTGQESYELAAYYLARKTRLDATKRGRLGYLFFLADESPYEQVSAAQVKRLIGDNLPADISAETIFKELATKFHIFVIFPRTTAQQRQASIDNEIRQRLIKAGGRFQDVAIRASLVWYDRTDLDLHCMTPAGEHIYYGTKRDRTGGFLDVDMNIGGETEKPVENIRWAKGDAPNGTYQFYVQRYAHHGPVAPTPFRVELEVDGEIQHFDGIIPARQLREDSTQQVFKFQYKAGERQSKDHHNAYSDEVILANWRRYVPATNILRVEDPASSVDSMVGAMALQNGTMTLPQFIESMKNRPSPAPDARCSDVAAALADFAKHGVITEVPNDLF